MTRSWPVAGGVFSVIWVFVHGPPLSPEPIAGSLLVGLAVGVPTAYVFRRLYGESVDLGRSVRGLPYMVLYTLAFIREAVVASIDVTYRVLAPSGPVEPEVILIPLRVQTDLGVTTIANSITMTPGSLTLDYDSEENALYVHVIDGERSRRHRRPDSRLGELRARHLRRRPLARRARARLRRLPTRPDPSRPRTGRPRNRHRGGLGHRDRGAGGDRVGDGIGGGD